MREIDGKKLRGHIAEYCQDSLKKYNQENEGAVEPSLGWTTSKLLLCESGRCGFCNDCIQGGKKGQLPSDRWKSAYLERDYEDEEVLWL